MTRSPSKKKAKSSWQSVLFTLHLWLGLGSGLLFSIVCATGFLIALHPILEVRFNQEVLLVQQDPKSVLPSDEVIAQGLKELKSSPRSVLIPSEPERAWILRGQEHRVYLDPTSGKALGELPTFWEDSYRTLVRLHRWLLLDSEVGRPITGAATLIYLVILASGAGLWLNKCYRNLGRGLSFRRNVGWKRWTYDAHLVLGIYALLPLFLMSATGLYWSYREPYKAVVYAVLDGAPAPKVAKKEKKKKGEAPPKQTDLPYQKILDTVNAELPYPGEIRFGFPNLDSSTIEVEKIRVAGPFQFPTRDELVLDVKTGAVVSKKPFDSMSRAEKLLSQIYNLHTGAFLGDLTLVLYLLATVVGTSLPITGTIMWWNRQRGLRKAKEIMAKRAKEKPTKQEV